MSYLTAAALGLVQGVAEFLPISSSGHLALLQSLFQVEEADLLFDVLLHLGSLLALLLAYRRDLRQLRRGFLGMLGLGRDRGPTTRKNLLRRRLALLVAVGTVPLVLAIPLRGWVAGMYHQPMLVGAMLMLTGFVLHGSDRLSGGNRGGGTARNMRLSQAVLIGIVQVFGVIPGLSRSGLTIAAGQSMGLRRSFAVRYSFLLSVPAVLGAVVISLLEKGTGGIDTGLLPQYLLGMLNATVSGYLCINLVRYLASRTSFGGFAYYLWCAGLVTMALSLVA